MLVLLLWGPDFEKHMLDCFSRGGAALQSDPPLTLAWCLHMLPLDGRQQRQEAAAALVWYLPCAHPQVNNSMGICLPLLIVTMPSGDTDSYSHFPDRTVEPWEVKEQARSHVASVPRGQEGCLRR